MATGRIRLAADNRGDTFADFCEFREAAGIPSRFLGER